MSIKVNNLEKGLAGAVGHLLANLPDDAKDLIVMHYAGTTLEAYIKKEDGTVICISQKRVNANGYDKDGEYWG